MDVSFALAGFLMEETVGLSTVVCACLAGPTAQIFFPFSEKLCRSILKEDL